MEALAVLRHRRHLRGTRTRWDTDLPIDCSRNFQTSIDLQPLSSSTSLLNKINQMNSTAFATIDYHSLFKSKVYNIVTTNSSVWTDTDQVGVTFWPAIGCFFSCSQICWFCFCLSIYFHRYLYQCMVTCGSFCRGTMHCKCISTAARRRSSSVSTRKPKSNESCVSPFGTSSLGLSCQMTHPYTS